MIEARSCPMIMSYMYPLAAEARFPFPCVHHDVCIAGGDHVRSFKMDPQVFAGSKPEQRAMDARDGSLAHFVYTRDGDNGGLIYWLGTRRLVAKIFARVVD